ncbi:MAG: hypothetical protein KGP28_02800 [Bdellovibrionales bacterium]|nr:hypothetical protein [Bdellovibrionales bacterium]
MTTTTQTPSTSAKKNLGRRSLKKLGRDKRKAKLQADKAFSKTYHEAKSKRSIEKKNAFRKKKSKK